MIQKVCWNNRYLVEDRYTSQKVERSFRDFLQNLSKSYKRSNFFEHYNIQQLFVVVPVYRKNRRSLPNVTSAWTKFVRKLLFVGNVSKYVATRSDRRLLDVGSTETKLKIFTINETCEYLFDNCEIELNDATKKRLQTKRCIDTTLTPIGSYGPIFRKFFYRRTEKICFQMIFTLVATAV